MQGNCNKFKAFENSFFLLLLINLKPLYEEKKNKRIDRKVINSMSLIG